MKKNLLSLFFVLAASFVLAAPIFGNCVKIQSGLITDNAGNVIRTGFDQWGYNYQAHMFNGIYENFTRPSVPVTDGLVNLQMKWSDDWLSNLDCNADNKLDRGGAAGATNIS